MPRRTFEVWAYHIYNRWLEKMIIYKNKSDFEKFYNLVIKYSKLGKYSWIKILSYSFLPNHFHFVVSTSTWEISGFFWDIQNAYSKYFNLKYDRKWQLFEWRFKSKIILNDEYLWKCLAYVNFNALKHEIVNDIQDYPRTSYHQIEKTKIDKYKDLMLDELEF